MNRCRVAVLLATVTLLVAGCGGLPDSGPAGAGVPINDSPVEPLQAAPQGPRPDADPAEIVGGFLRAGAGFGDDHAVARSFLVGEAAQAWRPDAGTVVYAEDASLRVNASGAGARMRVEVSSPVKATIDESGRYVQARPGTQATAVFTAVQAGGEWRVSGLDDGFGLWLPQYEVERAYAPVRISYVAAGTHLLVPDLRWFGGARAGLATAMVRQLLAGPPEYLRDALVTGAPPGTRLAVDAVPSTDGTAQVDLSSTVLSSTPQQRQQLWSQVSTTLGQLPGVSGVELTSGGTALAVPGLKEPASGDLGYADDVRVTGAPIVVSADRMSRVETSTGKLAVAPADGPDALPDPTGLRSVAAGPDASTLAAVDSTGRRLVSLRRDGTRIRLVNGVGLVDPSVDVDGFVWVADVAVPGVLMVVSTTPAGTEPATVTRIDPAWLRGRTVRSVDVSRDGARLAVVSSAADGSRRLDVSGVVRDGDRRPVRLSASALEVGQSLGDVRDVAWADRSNLAVLARSGTGPVRPFQVVVGGVATALPPVTDPVSVAVGDGLRAVYVTTATGQVLTRSGSGWRVVGPGHSVTVPQ